MPKYDRGSKWLIEHCGDSILRLAGIENIESWTALQAELVTPGRLPDGLLEVQLAGESERDLFLRELSTYSESRLEEQLAREMMLVYTDRGIIPECIGVVLHPKGRFIPSDEIAISSRLRLSECRFRWRIVKLWELDAESLFAAGDVGLIPWVPLTRFELPEEEVFQRCRDTIDASLKDQEHDKMLAVTQVLASLRYNDEVLEKFFQGKKTMIEFPAIQELVTEGKLEGKLEGKRESIFHFLRNRFKSVPTDVEQSVLAIRDPAILDDIIAEFGGCLTIEEFRSLLDSIEKSGGTTSTD